MTLAVRNVSGKGQLVRAKVAILGILLLMGSAGPLSANSAVPPRLAGMVPDDRRPEIAAILANPTFVRRLDFQVLADVRVYTFLLDHPDLNAVLARALRMAPYELVNIGPGKYRGDDGGGNVGTLEVFHASGDERAFLESGVSSGWWFGDIGGRVVALVVFSTEQDRVQGTVTVWARIDQGAVDRLLRALKPMLGGFLDRKLREQFNIAARVAEVAAQQPDHFCSLLEEKAGESPDERQALASLARCTRLEQSASSWSPPFETKSPGAKRSGGAPPRS